MMTTRATSLSGALTSIWSRLAKTTCQACGEHASAGSICSDCFNRAGLGPVGYWLKPGPPGIGLVRFCALHAPVQITPQISPLTYLLHRFKYGGDRSAGRVLSGLFAQTLEAQSRGYKRIVPVALASKRMRARGFNQSGWLADSLAARSGTKLGALTLTRSNGPPPQRGLSARQRRKNLDGVFRCTVNLQGVSPVLLVDDVMTTGATLREAASALRDCGATTIDAAVLLLVDRR